MLGQGGPLAFGGSGAVGSDTEAFANPFRDVSGLMMPDQFRNVLYWSEYIYSHSGFGTFRMATERIISYFLTDIEISGEVADEEKKNYTDFLCDTVDGIIFLQSMLRDRACYGNAFASVIVPFRRFLQPPNSHDLYPLKEVYENPNFQFAWQDFQFIATDPKTGRRGPWKVVDKTDKHETTIRLKRWSPHDIHILHDPFTEEMAYFWRIPEDYKKLVRDGHLYHLERAPEQVLKAIRQNKMYRFRPDMLFHMREPTLAGLKVRGWGLPRVLSVFRQIFYVQVLRRQNEAIAMDYVIPFRLITPEMRRGGGGGNPLSQDMLQTFSGSDFSAQMRSMLRRRRRDPAGWNVLPFPVNYQMLGGDAQHLAPTELLDQGMETLLNDIGTPVELYKGTLQLQVAPVALRLFEATFYHLVYDANKLLQWAADQLSRIMSWKKVVARLRRVTIADDLEKQRAALQLMISQQLSGKSGLRSIGFDWETEQKQLAEEARKQSEIQARMQEEMEQAGFAQQLARGGMAAEGGQPMPGGQPQGDPAAGGQMAGGQPGTNPAQMALGGGQPVTEYVKTMGPNVPVTPDQMMETAQHLADELMGLPESQKNSELRQLQQYNPVLHSIVKETMQKKRYDARMQGGEMLMQQH